MGIYFLYYIYSKNIVMRIVITESQFNRLNELILESTYQDFFSKIKIGDELNIEMQGGRKRVLRVSKLGRGGRAILNFGAQKVMITPNNFRGQKQLVVRVGTSAQPTSWPASIWRIEKIELKRGGNTIETFDTAQSAAPTQPQSPSAAPQPQPSSGSTQTSSQKTNISIDDILNDEALQNAYYGKPNFWKLLKAELKKEKAKGSGIIRARELLDNFGYYGSEYMNKYFPSGKYVKMTPIKDYALQYTFNNTTQTFSINDSSMYALKVGQTSRSAETMLILKNVTGGVNCILKVKDAGVKKKISNNNEVTVFKCEVMFEFRQGNNVIPYNTNQEIEMVYKGIKS